MAIFYIFLTNSDSSAKLLKENSATHRYNEEHMSLIDILIYLLAGTFLLILGTVFHSIYTHGKKTDAENRSAAEDTVQGIMEEIRCEHRQRWINDTTVEFVYLILGKASGQDLVWARVQVVKTGIRVAIEYYWDIQRVHIDWAWMIVDAFKGRGVEATLKSSDRQPEKDETGVPFVGKGGKLL